MLGGFLALLSAATFALNNASMRRGVLTGSVAQAMAITVPIGVPLLALIALPFGALGLVFEFSAEALVWLAVAGVIHFVWGRYCNYRATKAMGAVLVGPVQQASLVVTLGLAILILGETLTPLRILGIVLVVVGPSIGLREDAPKTPKAAGAADKPAKAAFKPNYVEGYTYAILSCVGYGVSPILVRYGLEDAGLAASVAGTLVSYFAAAVAILLFLALWPGQMRHAFAVDRVAVKWFTLSGVMVCLSQLFRYMALSVAPVSVVTPIQRTSILFRVVFAWLLNRDHEVFGGKMVLATVVSLIGALALSVSTEAVLALLPWPEWVVAVARWQWP